MNYIVLDLEWNQSSTGKNRVSKSLPFEIIEIGAVKLNETFEIIDSFQSTIKPVIYPQMHYISQEITGFTASELQQGGSFPEVFRSFMNWCKQGNSFRFCTWGSQDLTELQRNMKYYHISLFPAPVFFYDIQEIFSIIHDDGIIRRSLEYTVEFFRIDKTEGFHRALSDAFYTAKIMTYFDNDDILNNYNIDTYQQPKSATDEVFMLYGNHSRYLSRTFATKSDVMKDAEVLSTKCCICNKRLRKKVHWFSENSKNYYSLAYCPEHGFLTGKIHIKKNDRNRYFAIKELKLTDEAGANIIHEKRLEYTRKRNLKRR